MRRALGAFLILTVLGGQLGMLGALLVGRHRVRQRMRRRVADVAASPGSAEAVRHLALSHAERHGPESSFVRLGELEFRYRGHRYDVVRAERRGTVLHVWVLHDHREEQYRDALSRTLETSRMRAPSSHAPVAWQSGGLAPALVAGAGGLLPSPVMGPRSLPHLRFSAPQPPNLEVPHPPPWG